MYKKYLILFCLVLFLSIAGFGCKGLTAAEQASIKPVALNYWTVYNDLEQLNKFAAVFQKMYPYVTVNIRKVREDQFNELFINALADDVPPDIISVNVRDLRKYLDKLDQMPASAEMSRLYVTGKYFKETVVQKETVGLPTALSVKANFVDTVYNDAVVSDKVYGLPLALDNLAVYYNKDLLDQTGIPEPPKNWSEFMEAVKKTTRFDKEGEIIQSGAALGTANNISRQFDILSLLMMQSGVTMAKGLYPSFADGIDQARNNHSSLSALRFYTDFARSDKDVYTWNEKMRDSLESFTRGKSVFYFGFAYDYPKIKSQAPQLNLEIIPMLQLNEEKPVNIANYWLESVVKKSKYRNEAWNFIGFMASPANIEAYTQAARRPTPLRAQINKQKEDPILSPFVSQILQSQNWYRGKNASAAEKAFANLVTNYLKPYSSEHDPTQRDVELIKYTAQVVGQTM